MNYRETGNKIPISEIELSDYVRYKLQEFDDNPDISPNPYTQPIIYKTKDNKVIMVPTDIHEKVLNKWHNNNNNTKQPPKAIYVYEKNDWVKLGLLILAAMIALYFFYDIGHKTQSFQMDEPITYHLVL